MKNEANEEGFTIDVDVTNPGQFFACCGLLELASRFFQSATGHFTVEHGKYFFHVRTDGEKSIRSFFSELANAPISSSLTPADVSRLKTLQNTKKSTLTSEIEAEKAALSKKRDQERIRFGGRFNLELDWWNNDATSKLKTWAGKQLVTELLDGIFAPLRTWEYTKIASLLERQSTDGSLPFYFDSNIGSSSSSLDVGYSLDALGIRSGIRPAIELFAFVGLQRFAPTQISDTFAYRIWYRPLPVILAAAACSNGYPEHSSSFYFTLLYRTKYLKAFLPSQLKLINHEPDKSIRSLPY